MWNRKLHVQLLLPRRHAGCCGADRGTWPGDQKSLPEDVTLKVWPQECLGTGRAFLATRLCKTRQNVVPSGLHLSARMPGRWPRQVRAGRAMLKIWGWSLRVVYCAPSKGGIWPELRVGWSHRLPYGEWVTGRMRLGDHWGLLARPQEEGDLDIVPPPPSSPPHHAAQK